MKRSQPRILIFDSGVGGLSIFAEIRQALPWCELVFASDSAGFPYGIRGEGELIERVDKVLGQLLDRVQPDIAVIACNSASTVVLPVIRSRYPVPFVGVVPAIKPAAAQSRSRSIGLLATPATVARPYTRQLIEDFAADCQVNALGSSELVYLAEAKLRGRDPEINEIRRIIRPLFDTSLAKPMDTVVLACTHFPLLRNELEQAAPWPVQWIDSAGAIARRTASLLGDNPTGLQAIHSHSAIFTGAESLDAALATALEKLDIHNTEQLDI